MLRLLLSLALVAGTTLPLAAGEMDNDATSKKPAITPATVSILNIASSELDDESPTQSWRRYGWGGWGYRGGYGWGGGWRGGYGWGGGWGGYRPYYGYGFGYGCYRPYYGGWNVGFGYYRPWGGISISYGW